MKPKITQAELADIRRDVIYEILLRSESLTSEDIEDIVAKETYFYGEMNTKILDSLVMDIQVIMKMIEDGRLIRVVVEDE